MQIKTNNASVLVLTDVAFADIAALIANPEMAFARGEMTFVTPAGKRRHVPVRKVGKTFASTLEDMLSWGKGDAAEWSKADVEMFRMFDGSMAIVCRKA